MSEFLKLSKFLFFEKLYVFRNTPPTTPIVQKQEPQNVTPSVISLRPRLGQVAPGREPVPRPEPDDSHPCGPFDKDRGSPPPTRTLKPFENWPSFTKGSKSRFGTDFALILCKIIYLSIK